MSASKAIRRLWKPLGMMAAIVVVVGVIVLLFGPVAWWATPAKHLQGKDKADAINTTRQILLATLGGLVVLIGAIFSVRTYNLSRRGQFTARYATAIGHLASDKLTERIGGIYSLECLMRESAVDHETVVEVLAAFIRETARAQSTEPAGVDSEAAAGESRPLRPATDVQAALTVLGRRPQRPEANRIDLAYTDLRGARLAGARFDRATLGGAQLQHAMLARAQLQDTYLYEAQLQDAYLFEAQLEDAHLDRAQLQDASLGYANLQGASLDGSQLSQADLANAKLQRASLIRAELQASNLFMADLRGADLTMANLQGAHLVEAQLQEATFLGTQLQLADLREAQLCDPDGGRAAIDLDASQLLVARVDASTVMPAPLRAAITPGQPPMAAGEPES